MDEVLCRWCHGAGECKSWDEIRECEVISACSCRGGFERVRIRHTMSRDDRKKIIEQAVQAFLEGKSRLASGGGR